MSKEQVTGKDNILAFLVQATNKHNLPMDIALNVNGAIVTGTLLSAKEYFRLLGKTFEDGSEVAQKLSEKLAEAGESIETSEDADADFIHLKDAKVYSGNSKPTPSKGEILWRGPLSDINGFFLESIPNNGEDEEASDDSDFQSLKEKNGKLTDRIGRLEEMISKLNPNGDEEEGSAKEEQEDSEKDVEAEESAEDQSEETDEDKEKNQKKPSGNKSSTTKRKKRSPAKKTSKSK
jgi:hypothetical protein